MANRDALRELQVRLAQRLEAARDTGQQAAWLAVEAGGTRWLLPLAQAGEIFPYSAPLPVPYTQDWFLGVANLRGGLWGVADLAAFAGGHPPAPRTEADLAQARFVTLNPALEVNSALLVDRLAGLRGLDDFCASAPAAACAAGTAAGEVPRWFGSLYTDPQGVCWQEVNLQALSQQPQFLGIVAHGA